jgi:hypothetical protein
MRQKFILAALALLLLSLSACNIGSSLRVVNGTDESICYLYLSSANQREWGNDRLGSQRLSPGEEFTVGFLGNGSYDIKVEFCDTGRDPFEDYDVQVNGDTVYRVELDE